MRVLHFIPDVATGAGGVARAVIDWARVLPAERTHVTLALLDPIDVPPEWPRATAETNPALPTVNVLDGGRRMGPFNARVRAAARTALAEADVLHLHGMWLRSNAAFARLARQANVPYVVSVHGMLNDWAMTQRPLRKRTYLQTLARRFIRGAAAFHCTTQEEAAQAGPRLLAAGATRLPIVIPPVLDVAPFRQPPDPGLARSQLLGGIDDQRPIVLFLSRLHEVKGLHVLIEAAALLGDRKRPITLVVAGEDDNAYGRAMHDLAQRHKLLEKGPRGEVRFVGGVDGALKHSLYAAADLLALPTFQENFGFVLPEAMGCGTPVVTTRNTGIWRDVENAGGCISDLTPPAFADAIFELLGDEADLRRRAELGRRWVLESLDGRRVADHYRRLYADIRGAS